MRNPDFNPVNWFEIPVKDMRRAMKFYKDVLGYECDHQTMDGMEMAFFPSKTERWGCGGMLSKQEKVKPSRDCVKIYFASPSQDLASELAKVHKAGGKVLHPKTSIGKYGHMAVFEDTEGNAICLHSMK